MGRFAQYIYIYICVYLLSILEEHECFILTSYYVKLKTLDLCLIAPMSLKRDDMETFCFWHDC